MKSLKRFERFYCVVGSILSLIGVLSFFVGGILFLIPGALCFLSAFRYASENKSSIYTKRKLDFILSFILMLYGIVSFFVGGFIFIITALVCLYIGFKHNRMVEQFKNPNKSNAIEPVSCSEESSVEVASIPSSAIAEEYRNDITEKYNDEIHIILETSEESAALCAPCISESDSDPSVSHGLSSENKEIEDSRISHEGQSLFSLPVDFTVIDIETTGLSSNDDKIIEMSAIKVRDLKIVEEYSSLVNPNIEISDFIVNLTGITNEMLKNERTICAIMPEFLDFVGNDIVVGHNVKFDINFICKNSFPTMFSNDFVDTMRLSKKLLKEQRHHRLSDVCGHYNIDYVNAHRSLSDCRMTLDCYKHIKNDIEETFGNIENLIKSRRKKTLKAKEIVSDASKVDTSSLLYGKVCAFSGVLNKMSRTEAKKRVVEIGGMVSDTVTKKTNFLILGNNDGNRNIKDGKSSKQKKAEKYKLDGLDIEIIPENDFYNILNL